MKRRSGSVLFSRFVLAFALISIAYATAVPVFAQTSVPLARDASGTAWQPDETPMYALHWQRGAWELMAHENVFLQFLHESGNRGDEELGSINWIMGMAQRSTGPGRLQFRAMFSAEPATIRGCGYPDLLATGERCSGVPLHDQQHAHDVMMEIAAEYNAPLRGSTRWQIYGGAAGEPALGPAAYPHRVSAMPNPLAPISHHWMDATHVTFGLITGGVYGGRWKIEGSVFNGREPDEKRTNVDFGSLDSASGRVWFLPSPKWALQMSVGRLAEGELAEDGLSGVDVTRATASATYHRGSGEAGVWATTVAWGRNAEPDHSSNAFLAETNLTIADRDTLFGRFEIVSKSAHDLQVAYSPDSFAVAKLQAGYTRYLRAWSGLRPGLGASISAGVVPERLRDVYGSRVNAGLAVFLTLRPAAMSMMSMTMPGDHTMMEP